MSTVGYGDIACKTVFGRIFIIIFIFGALVSSLLYLLFEYLLKKTRKNVHATELKAVGIAMVQKVK